jgi:hypothetical protein
MRLRVCRRRTYCDICAKFHGATTTTTRPRGAKVRLRSGVEQLEDQSDWPIRLEHIGSGAGWYSGLRPFVLVAYRPLYQPKKKRGVQSTE